MPDANTPPAVGRTHPVWSYLGLDLVTLRVIVAAAEEGSFARAAERENIALSAVSRRISDFEGRAGVLIFNRRDRGVTLTDAGTTLLTQLREIFERFDRVALDLEAVRAGTRGLVRVHTHMTATAGTLPEKLAAFVFDNPNIDLQVIESTSTEIVHSVEVGTADVGLISGTLPPSGLSYIPWQQDELVVVLPPGHPMAGHEMVHLRDLVDEPFIGMQRDSSLLSLYRQHMNALGRKLRERAYATSFESVRKMVSVGLGVAILPATAAYPYTEELKINVRKLGESWATRTLVLCAPPPEKRSAATKLLIKHLIGSE